MLRRHAQSWSSILHSVGQMTWLQSPDNKSGWQLQQFHHLDYQSKTSHSILNDEGSSTFIISSQMKKEVDKPGCDIRWDLHHNFQSNLITISQTFNKNCERLMAEVALEEVSKSDYVKYKKCERLAVKKPLLAGYEESCPRKHHNFKSKTSSPKLHHT